MTNEHNSRNDQRVGVRHLLTTLCDGAGQDPQVLLSEASSETLGRAALYSDLRPRKIVVDFWYTITFKNDSEPDFAHQPNMET